ncbi:ATP-binding protein [Desmonostoc muscorum LEGE 12446]
MNNSSDLRKNYIERVIANLKTDIETISKQILRTLDDVEKNKLQRQIDDKFDEMAKAESELNELNRESIELESDKIPFTNRDDAISEITAINSPPYRLVTAPEGYGKTEFLKQIMGRFQELQWCCAYASMSSYESIEDLEKRLANSLQLPLPEGYELNSGDRLGLLLHRNWAKCQSQGKKGIVLLIDLDGNAPPKQRLNEIFNDFQKFVGRIERCLKELQFFKDNSRRLRVVIAARCLIDIPLDRTFPRLILSPFNWEVIQDTATKYLKPIEMTSESLALLSGHLLYLTGGHPGGIAEALKVYRSGAYTVSWFLNSYGNQLWEKKLKKCRDQIKETLTTENNHLYESIEKLSIFPILNGTWVLKEAVRRFQLPFSDDSFKLNAELTKTSIFTRDKTIIKDGMTRRLLVIGLLRETSPDNFQKLCSEAAQICWEYIHELKSKNNSAVAGTWSMQYFFQSLQQHAGFINFGANSLAYRQKLRQDFFDKTVEETLEIFRNTDREQMHEFLYTLKSEVENDWEFQFLVNYYLHNDEYNDTPYRDLIQKLDEAIQNN